MSRDMTGSEKLLFISCFVWFTHWGVQVFGRVLEMFMVGQKVLPLGL